jgi:hypothetical protein
MLKLNEIRASRSDSLALHTHVQGLDAAAGKGYRTPTLMSPLEVGFAQALLIDS